MTPDELDRQTQHAVLQFALECDPALLSDEEIVLAIAVDPDDAGERDSVIRALGELSANGLMHHRNGFAQPTRAATRAAQLLEI